MLQRIAGSSARLPPRISAFMRTVLDDASAALACATLGAVKTSGSQTLTGGFNISPEQYGTITGSNQTITPTPLTSNLCHATLNGSSLTGTLTFDVPASACSIIMQVVNGGSGAVGATLSTANYTKVDGSYATTNGNKYLFCIVRSNDYKYLNIVALQ